MATSKKLLDGVLLLCSLPLRWRKTLHHKFFQRMILLDGTVGLSQPTWGQWFLTLMRLGQVGLLVAQQKKSKLNALDDSVEQSTVVLGLLGVVRQQGCSNLVLFSTTCCLVSWMPQSTSLLTQPLLVENCWLQSKPQKPRSKVYRQQKKLLLQQRSLMLEHVLWLVCLLRKK